MNGSLHSVEGGVSLRFERRLAHPIEEVWRAVSERDELAHWFPARVEMDFRHGGTVRFTFPDGSESPDGVIMELESPRIFAYTWGDSLLRLALEPDAGDCLLVFSQTFAERADAAKFAAGWHVCLDALATSLDGEPVAHTHARWMELFEAYAQSFA